MFLRHYDTYLRNRAVFVSEECVFCATSAWTSALLICFLSQTATACKICAFWAACGSVAKWWCQRAVSCCFARQQLVQNPARETRRRRWMQAELICAATDSGGLTSVSGRPKPGCLCCRRKREMGWTAEVLEPVPAGGWKAVAAVLKDAGSWRNQYCRQSSAPKAAVLRLSLSYQSHTGEINHGAMLAYYLLGSVFCSCLLLFLQLSRECSENVSIGWSLSVPFSNYFFMNFEGTV